MTDSPLQAIVLILVFVAGVIAGHRSGYAEAAPSPSPPRLIQIDPALIRTELTAAEQDAIRRISATIQAETLKLREIIARVDYDHSSYAQGNVYRESPQTPVELALVGAQSSLVAAANLLMLPGPWPENIRGVG